jgi:hypothetical protein
MRSLTPVKVAELCSTITAGHFSLIVAHTSMPLMSGRRTSRSTTAGSSASTLVSASAPVAASTTS